MEATPGLAMAVMVMGATPTCTDLPRDLVQHMDMDTTEEKTFSNLLSYSQV